MADWTTPAAPTGRESLTTGPLDGLRVLDLTRVWAGPIAGRILGDLGADVIYVESPWNRGYRERDPLMATLGHLFPDNEPGERPWNRVGGVNKLARNKRGLTLNLRDARGRDLFAALVARSDVVLENYSPRVMPQLGFDFAALRKLNPRIVHTAMNGYGASGPGQNRVALGPVIEAAVGLTAMMGYADTGPYRSGVAWADPIAGLSAVGGTLVALWRREASGGEPQQVETAMSESMAVAAGEELLAAQVRGANAPRIGNRHTVYAPQGVYPCAGHDRWLAISVMTDAEWLALCDVAGIAGDLRDLDAAGRRARHDEIDAAIGAWTCAQSPGPAMARLQARGVIAAQVSDGRDLVEDPAPGRARLLGGAGPCRRGTDALSGQRDPPERDAGHVSRRVARAGGAQRRDPATPRRVGSGAVDAGGRRRDRADAAGGAGALDRRRGRRSRPPQYDRSHVVRDRARG